MRKTKTAVNFKNPTKVLAFDGSLKLVAVFGSYNIAERLTGITHQRLCKACNGEIVAANKHYWREFDDSEDVLESDDIGKLNLLDYDSKSNIDRKIYCSRKMIRGQEIPESQYGNRHQFIKTTKYIEWKYEQRKLRKAQKHGQ